MRHLHSRFSWYCVWLLFVIGSSQLVFAQEQPTEQLRKQYNDLEQKARQLAQKLRAPLPDPATGDRLRKELQETVKQSFAARQKLQRSELAEFARRLNGIQQSIESRDKISQQIIDRRVQELLNQNLMWDSVSPESSIDSLKPLPQPNDLSKTLSEVVPPVISSLAESVSDEDRLWELFGARFAEVGPEKVQNKNLRGGLKIIELLADGPAERSGMRVDDIVVGVDQWQTPSLSGLDYAWQQTAGDSVRVYLVRKFSSRNQTFIAELKWTQVDATGALPTDAAPALPAWPELQGTWELTDMTLNFLTNGHDQAFNPFVEGRSNRKQVLMIISGNTLTRQWSEGKESTHTIEYDLVANPKRLTLTSIRNGYTQVERFLVEVEQDTLRLASTTDGHHRFPKSFDENSNLIVTYKRVNTVPPPP